MSVFLKINESDNVAVALENLTSGTKREVAGSEIIIK